VTVLDFENARVKQDLLFLCQQRFLDDWSEEQEGVEEAYHLL